jgi:hypothetical protein
MSNETSIIHEFSPIITYGTLGSKTHLSVRKPIRTMLALSGFHFQKALCPNNIDFISGRIASFPQIHYISFMNYTILHAFPQTCPVFAACRHRAFEFIACPFISPVYYEINFSAGIGSEKVELAACSFKLLISDNLLDH